MKDPFSMTVDPTLGLLTSTCNNRRLVWLAAALAALVLLAGCGEPYAYKGTAFPEPLATPHFTLTSETGEPMELSDLRGKVVLIFFGYTTCPDFCPTTLGEARTVLEDLGKKADDVAFLFVTVDPDARHAGEAGRLHRRLSS